VEATNADDSPEDENEDYLELDHRTLRRKED
jgi:hypothetical protein